VNFKGGRWRKFRKKRRRGGGRWIKILNQSRSQRCEPGAEICDFSIKKLKKGGSERGRAGGVWKRWRRFTTKEAIKSFPKFPRLLAAGSY
jgi:hypothetical protein